MCAAIYTQTPDVETEVNGLLTYDRALNKVGADWLAKTHAALFEVAGTTKPKVILETGGTWAYAEEKQAKTWDSPTYDDSDWKRAPAPFGDPKAGAKTAWTSDNLWIRQAFEVDDPEVHELMLKRVAANKTRQARSV